MRITEFELIEKIRRRIPKPPKGVLGIGDDTAIFPTSGKSARLLTTDTLVEGVDFIIGKATPERIGRKALAVNLSDAAAMGGIPRYFVVSLGIPAKLDEKWVMKFYAGMMKLAEQYKVHCVGGDITRAKEFFVTIALTGEMNGVKPVLRSGAKVGDWIGVTGTLGGSILGKHFDFTPRLREARFLAENFRPNALMDISDGLIQDLEHILKASWKGALIQLGNVPISKDTRKKNKGNSQKALISALTDGEDFELLFTLPSTKIRRLEKAWKRHFPQVRLSWLGRVTAGKGIRYEDGTKPVIVPQIQKSGFSHF